MRPNQYIPRPAPLSLAAQAIGIRSRFPQGTITMTRNAVSWEGLLSPHEASREYLVQMLYQKGKHPHIYVRDPDLKILAGGRRLPHVYDQEKQRLCLYLPTVNFWTPQKPIAGTVMKWALAWLMFFELWLVTNTWHGRGVGHPGDDPTLYDF